MKKIERELVRANDRGASCKCGRARSYIAHLTYPSHNRNGKTITVQSMRQFCHLHAQAYASRNGLELPEEA